MRRNAALTAVILFGIVSLLGDIIYEGSRGIISPFLLSLGASAVAVGTALGAGEFLGYAMRGGFGALSDRTGSYWGFTIGGYVLLISIPLLALAGSWEIALALVIVERLSKALRTPARDTLLSGVAGGLGTGKAFGLHELLDQIGAVAGPAIVSLVLVISGKFQVAFAVLILPYLIMVGALAIARRRLGRATRPRRTPGREAAGGRPQLLRYSAAVLLNCAGLVPISLVLYRASSLGMVEWAIPLIYLGAQAVDAASALMAGYAYDRIGRKILYLPFALSLLPSAMVFGGGESVLASAIVFGVVYGMQESVYRAAVADMSPAGSRGTAYGIFHSLYGLGFLISGAMFGLFLDGNAWGPAVVYAASAQLLAIFLLSGSMR